MIRASSLSLLLGATLLASQGDPPPVRRERASRRGKESIDEILSRSRKTKLERAVALGDIFPKVIR